MSWWSYLLAVICALLLIYQFLYNSFQLAFVVVAFRKIRYYLRAREYEDLDVVLNSPFTPPLSIIVPAYNEEKTIVESLGSLIRLRFPRKEIIIVNDGSTDETLASVLAAFGLSRMEITYEERLTTMPIRAFYEKRHNLPAGVTRFVLLDKENGGKADALNAGINASTCPMFVSVDADSIIDEDALLQAFRVMLKDEGIVAIGGQVALANGCEVTSGRVLSTGLPDSSLARFQIVEYLRSFSIGRTALGELNSILIISGVFAIFRKDAVIKAGGYLTRFVTGKLVQEYVGQSRETVCEDMEIIVRLQRFLHEKKIAGRIGYAPYPLCWTEAPETFASLGKQRNRWMRGLIETLFYHRAMFMNRRHGVIGCFAYPFFLLFELAGAPLEFLGYLAVPVSFWIGILSFEYFLLFLLVSVAYGALVSVCALLAAAWSEQSSSFRFRQACLIRHQGWHYLVVLILYALLENFGYRQVILWWRMRGIWDYFFGRKGWDKFDRKGFRTPKTRLADGL
jgi:cellulose synthase/poly-beta-1,6-N-acetylglucosamine synthase-like glycosyltransferase